MGNTLFGRTTATSAPMDRYVAHKDSAKSGGQHKLERDIRQEPNDLLKISASELAETESDCELELSHQVVKELEKRVQQDLALVIGVSSRPVGEGKTDLIDSQGVIGETDLDGIKFIQVARK